MILTEQGTMVVDDRLTLEPLALGHEEAYVQCRLENQLALAAVGEENILANEAWMRAQFRYILRDTERGRAVEFGMFHNGNLIGEAGAGFRGNSKAEVHYWQDRAHQGNGYATQGVGALMNYLFTQKKVRTVEFRIVPMNIRSQRLAQRVGAVMVDERNGKQIWRRGRGY